MSFLSMLGLAPNEEDKRLKKLVQDSYKEVKVVGRGTIRIDPKEVSSSDEFKNAQNKARTLVTS
ncbi:MAG TPA: hypothetical protein PKY67_06680 [Nitrosomonas sp.]|nr:hypothetical protein [Nitrosomonas sp.]